MNAPTTFLNQERLPFPFCPGCGHGTILEKLDEALVRRGVDPKKLVLVSDIGCSGLSDAYFRTNAFHGLHGRSVTYATGIKLAHPELEVVVLMGDGGCGIGGHHLINAARRNVGITVVVFNNMNYGMTGGEHSVSTPPDAWTATTKLGQIERPMDICSTVAVNGASFVARATTFDADLPDTFGRALDNDGFSLVDVWELCTAYFAPANKVNRKSMVGLMDGLGFQPGVLVDAPRPEFSKAYRAQHEAVRGTPALPPRPLEARFTSRLEGPVRWVVAGAAGKKMISAAGALARAGVMSGLQASQRSDYPVTVKTGFALSEVILSPDRIRYTGIQSPDVLIVLFPEGLAKARSRAAAMGPEGTVYVEASLPPLDTRARVVPLDFAAVEGWARKKDFWSLMAVAAAAVDTGAVSLEALEAAVAGGTLGEERGAAVRAGAGLL